jgi:hypothetical protein
MGPLNIKDGTSILSIYISILESFPSQAIVAVRAKVKTSNSGT